MSRIEDALEKALQLRKNMTAEPGLAARVPDAAPRRDDAGAADADEVMQPAFSQETMDRIRGQKMLFTLNDICSPFAEEFRKLKQNLVRLTTRDDFKNTILITSGGTSEGKSVTATNLAISLAQEFDHTVLLVDADLRRPTCGNLLCMDNGMGLSDCLLKGIDIGQAIVRTGIGKLSFLPAGTPLANPGELLASMKMQQLLKEMKHRYPDRYIILDSPPVLPFAETRTLGNLVDATLLVVREGMLSRSEIAETIEALRGANIIGTVFTQVQSAANFKSSSYRKYGYYYGYTER